MGFLYKRAVTIDHSKVVNTDQTDFPVLVEINDVSLKSDSNGGHVQSDEAFDLQFFSDSDLSMRLCVEREYYNPSTGLWVGWVKVPSLLTASDTVIYVAYGDASISSDPNDDATYGGEQVWTNGYEAVYHCGDGSSVGLNDSSPNGYTLTAMGGTPDAAFGKIIGAIGLSGGRYLKNTSIGFTGKITMSLWVKTNTTSGYQTLIAKVASSGARDWSMFFHSGDTSKIDLDMNSDFVPISVSPGWSTGVWLYLQGVADGTHWNVYLGGVLVGQVSNTILAVNNAGRYLQIGADIGGSNLSGYVDEIRISNIDRSVDWISTEYNNQNSPGTFLSVGSEIEISVASLGNFLAFL